MCGIAGFLHPESEDPNATLRAMTNALAHRGPDDSGTWTDGTAFLGHRRLAIIDLNDGKQPMLNHDGSVAVVFNGEIYNHTALRKHLTEKGHAFRTQCDTEVLLALWQEYGQEMPTFLRGMFAFVLWDTRTKTLFGARDRFGQKPLYLREADGSIAFASELSSLILTAGFSADIDWQSIRHFFAYGVIPAPGTAYVGVKALPPASAFTFRHHAYRDWCYWRLEPQPNPGITLPKAKERFGELFEESVSLRMMSDVPLGAFLSGGLDSSLVVAAMQRLAPDKIKTFSIGFSDPAWDESAYARQVAAHLDTEHTDEMVTPDAANLLDNMLEHFGEPFGDSSAIPVWSLARFARTRVTVALSGDGGDELFGGYARYVAGRLVGLYRHLPKALRHLLIQRILDHVPENTGRLRGSLIKSCRQFDRFATALDEDPHALAPRIFSSSLLSQLMPDLPLTHRDPVRERALRFAKMSVSEQMLFLDQETYLVNDLNTKVDRMSMAHGLEVRSPFQDHRLAEFAAELPQHLKIQWRTGKYLLKKWARPQLPASIIYRKKQGFGVPVGAWLRGPLQDLWHATIRPELAEPLSMSVIDRLWREHQNGHRDWSYPLWHVLIFCRWRSLFMI